MALPALPRVSAQLEHMARVRGALLDRAGVVAHASSVQTKLEPQPLVVPEPLRTELSQWFASPSAGDAYKNPWEHAPVGTLSGVLRWKLATNTARPAGYRPRALALPPHALADFEGLASAETRIFWIGHASFLIAMDGVRAIIDPIFGRAAGVIPRVTPPAARAEELTDIQLVLVTHGHHDHLDPASLKAIAAANPDRAVFVVPKGLGSALPRACRPIVELSWWEHVTLSGLRVHLVPAQHWHKRGLFDTNKSLWGGFVLEGTHRVYHSGDTGYFGGFEAIGRAFGGVDAACLPLGAYEPRWFMSTQHMSPEQSLAAWKDLAATHFVGMHWGAFDLSDEPIDAGPRLLLDALAGEALSEQRFHVLSPGGSLALSGPRGNTQAAPRHLWQPG